MNVHLPGLLLLVVAFGCSPPPATDDSATSEAALESAIDTWVSAYEEGDAEAVAQLFTPDGIYAANTGEVLSGRSAIRDGVAAWIARRPPNVQLDLQRQPLRTDVTDGGAHTLLRFVIRAVPMDCTVDAGHALSVWHRQGDGSWRIGTHLVNRDPQAPPDACRQPAGAPDA